MPGTRIRTADAGTSETPRPARTRFKIVKCSLASWMIRGANPAHRQTARTWFMKCLGSRPAQHNERAVLQASKTFPRLILNLWRSYGNKTLANQRQSVESGPCNRHADDSYVDLAFEQGDDLCGGGHVFHLQFEMRISAAKTDNRGRKNLGNRGDSETNAQRAGTTIASF